MFIVTLTYIAEDSKEVMEILENQKTPDNIDVTHITHKEADEIKNQHGQ